MSGGIASLSLSLSFQVSRRKLPRLTSPVRSYDFSTGWLPSQGTEGGLRRRVCFNASSPVCRSCGAALVAGMPLCAVPVHAGRWRPGGGDGVQEAERRRLAPGGRHEPLLERDQAQVPQHPVRGHWIERGRRWYTADFCPPSVVSQHDAAYLSSPSSQQIHYWCYTVNIVIAQVLLSRGEGRHANDA